MELLQDVNHEHPLILCDDGMYDGGKVACCSRCRNYSSNGPIYGCTQCELFLHESCAELPKKILNTIHPAHPLELFSNSSSLGRSQCDRCESKLHGLGYHCPVCAFYLDTSCALGNMFEPKSHDHSFMLLKSTSFTCDACGRSSEESKRVSCLCTTCQLQVHEACSSSFPLTVKQIGHSHKLSFTYTYQIEDDVSNKLCKICYCMLNRVLCVYYCTTCDYIAHLRCATSTDSLRNDETFVIEDENQECKTLVPVEPSVGSITTEDAKEISCIGEDQKPTEHLQHFSHEHGLILRNDEPKSDEICDGCTLPISVPFYTCVNQCNFSLHKQCAELPNEILHPLHEHRLILKAKHPRDKIGFFYCYGCFFRHNGFTYKCIKCNFCIDVKCSLFSDTLKHDGHDCDLKLIPLDEPVQCSTCGSNCSTKFRCEECNFNLDLKCASLPNTTGHKCPKHNWDTRPMKLTYHSIEDESGIYYCDICEECRGQNHWFYDCQDCVYSVHPQCALGEHLIKYGKTDRFKCHMHPLTLVKKAKEHPPCASCGDPCHDLFLVCAECDIYFHPTYKCYR